MLSTNQTTMGRSKLGNITFGELLRSLREGRGETLRSVASAIGMRHAYLGQIERGERLALSERRIEEIADVLHCSPAERRQLKIKRALSLGYLDISGLPEEHIAAFIDSIERARGKK